jgi:hypothetical protein
VTWLPRFVNSVVGPKQVRIADTGRLQPGEGVLAGDVQQAALASFVLLVRTFGHDRTVRIGDPRDGIGFSVGDLETVASGVTASYGLSLRAFHDRRARSIAPGPEVVTSEFAGWREDFVRQISAARAIVAWAPPRGPLGDSFRWELSTIRDRGLADRVIVVGPLRKTWHSERVKVGMFTDLGWVPPPAPPLVAYRGASGRITVHPALGADDDSLRTRFETGLHEALSHLVQTG